MGDESMSPIVTIELEILVSKKNVTCRLLKREIA